MFSMLDDQLHVPGATDISFLQKINSALKKDKFYVSPKSTSQGKFGVRHYAGEVCDLSSYWLITCVDNMCRHGNRLRTVLINSLIRTVTLCHQGRKGSSRIARTS